jgi:hypothetical protein
MWKQLILFLRIFALRATPVQVPYSTTLLVLLAILVFITKIIVNDWFIDIIKVYDKKLLIDLSVASSALIVAVHLLILFAAVRTLLAYYKVPERSVQVITAFLGVDLIFTVLFLIWMFGLEHTTLPLQAGSIAGLLLILYFVVILYWQFMVYIHIIYNSVTMSVLRAGVLALVYMLIQHNISEVLMNTLLTGEPLT